MSPDPQAGKPRYVAQTFLSAGSGDFPVARPSPTFNHTPCLGCVRVAVTGLFEKPPHDRDSWSSFMIAQNPNNNCRMSPCLFSPAPIRVSDLIRVWLCTAFLWVGSAAATAVAAEVTVADLIAAGHWPQFRGPGASRVGDGQNLPEHWNRVKGENVRWKKSIPGL